MCVYIYIYIQTDYALLSVRKLVRLCLITQNPSPLGPQSLQTLYAF